MAKKRSKGPDLRRPSPRPPTARRRRTAVDAPLRGNVLATVDDHGRLKLPAAFRRTLVEAFGPALFVTSLHGDSMWVYPLTVWADKEERLAALSSQQPAVAKFLARVNYYGSETELDSSGRFVVPPLLRSSAGIEGEVAVLGALNHLDVWNNAKFRERLEREPFTDDDHRALAALGL